MESTNKPDPNDPRLQQRHVQTWPPVENVAPEVYPGAVRQEPGAAAQSDDINITMVILSFLFCMFLLVVMIGFVEAYYYNSTNDEQEAKSVPQPKLLAAREQWQQQLNAPAGWTDAKKTSYRMPIDDAIDAEVAIEKEAAAPVTVPQHQPKGST
jgi:hypothetical protein